MTELGIRLMMAAILLMIFVLVFSAAWIWMKRYDAKSEELTRLKHELKMARESASTWRQIAEDIANAVEGRGA